MLDALEQVLCRLRERVARCVCLDPCRLHSVWNGAENACCSTNRHCPPTTHRVRQRPEGNALFARTNFSRADKYPMEKMVPRPALENR